MSLDSKGLGISAELVITHKNRPDVDDLDVNTKLVNSFAKGKPIGLAKCQA